MTSRSRMWRLVSPLMVSLLILVVVDATAGPARFGASPSAGALTVTGPGTRYTVQGTKPSSITTGSDGALWFTEWAKDRIGRITMAGHVSKWTLPTADAGPTSIVAGPDGNLWFTETGIPRGPTIDQIGRITPQGAITEFPINGRPVAITAGPEGDLWFTAEGPTGPEIGQMSSGGIVGYTALRDQGLTAQGATASGITTGSDGNLWFTTDDGEIGRMVPSGNVSFFDIPGGGVAGTIADGPDGNLWFTGYSTSSAAYIGRITTNGAISRYPIASEAQGITAGPDGNIWFTLYNTDQIGRMNAAAGIAGQVAYYSVAIDGGSTPAGPYGITTGPDGNIWFTDWIAGAVAEYGPPPVVSQTTISDVSDNLAGVAPGPNGDRWITDDGNQVDHVCATGAVQHYTLPSSLSQPYSIIEGPWPRGIGGTFVGMWFTEADANKIGVFPERVSDLAGPCPTYALTEYTIPTTSSKPLGITRGPDGALWFTEAGADKIGRVTTTGRFSTFPIPTAGSYPTSIVTGPDGNLWFTEYGADQIGRITPAGVVTEFKLPTPNAEPNDITVGSDGNLWFTEYGAGRVASMTTEGVVTFDPPLSTTTTNCRPMNIVTGPDGSLWFTELDAGKVGRLTTTGDYSTFNVGDHPMGIAVTGSGLAVTDSIGAVGDLATLVPPGHHAVILPSGPAPAISTAGIGTETTVEWTERAPTDESVTDASGMGLFTSGSLFQGSDYSFRFTAAGTYPYAVAPTGTVDPPANGTVKVAPYGYQIAFGTYITVKWAAEQAPSGYRYDVQVEAPGGTYVDWMKGTKVASGVFDTDGTQGPYYFRARLRDLANGAHSGWSPPALVFVQGTPFSTTP